MRAMTYSEYGEPSILELTDAPMPKASPGAVVIRVERASVNPVDWKVMAGYLDPLIDAVFPVVPGWDVAGVVTAVGIDTPEYAVGDEVMAYARKDVVGAGTFAERVAVPAPAVARKPSSLSWEQAGGLPLAGGTALRTIDRLGVQEGDTLLIH